MTEQTRIKLGPGELVYISDWGPSPITNSAGWLEVAELLHQNQCRFFAAQPPELPADEPKPFPNWQPVKCSDECCGWHGPAAKSVKWGEGDPHQYCPKCWNKVVKHESNGGSPP